VTTRKIDAETVSEFQDVRLVPPDEWRYQLDPSVVLHVEHVLRRPNERWRAVGVSRARMDSDANLAVLLYVHLRDANEHGVPSWYLPRPDAGGANHRRSRGDPKVVTKSRDSSPFGLSGRLAVVDKEKRRRSTVREDSVCQSAAVYAPAAKQNHAALLRLIPR